MDFADGSAGRRGVPRFSEILRRPRGEAEVTIDSPDLDFRYDDSDTYIAEMAELYSYSEECEFFLNKKAFEEATAGLDGERWLNLSAATRSRYILSLLDMMEVSSASTRTKAVRAVLYLCQGTFIDCDTEAQHARYVRENAFLLYECGAFTTLAQLLNIEVDNCTATSAALCKPAVSLADSAELRALLSAMYTIVETVRRVQSDDDEGWAGARENLRADLMQPLTSVGGEGCGETLAIILFSMISKFGNGMAPNFPMKKVLLLLWKVVLMTLGGLGEIHVMRNDKRVAQGLSVVSENTHEVCGHMRASSPPASAADLIEQHQQVRRPFRASAAGKKHELTKQSSLGGAFEDTDELGDDGNSSESSEGDDGNTDTATPSDEEVDLPSTPPRPATPAPSKSLPWTPKVRQRDLDLFLEHTRSKFVGFNVRNDMGSLAGLPHPIHEGVRVLNQHLYVSLSEIQVKREEDIAKNPLSRGEGEIAETPTELLYRSMLPNLPNYMISLLKILLAAAPTSKAKTDSVNILADVIPEEMPTSVLHSMKLGIDVNRHKEIIVKAISALLLLLLKHFKLNHVYQFEFMSQHLVFANCIPLVLKFFNQNIGAYVAAKNTVLAIDFPACIIGGRAIELTAESLEMGDDVQYCWRNLFSCINLLRMLNKLTKWKHSRTMMLVVFKSAPILKRALRVKHAMMQLYILKLLKVQTKYLGRQWRKSNMKTMSAIYQKVRHRLTDDWAYGNDMDARPWDFQAEECSLRTCVERFNNRRYGTVSLEPDFDPVDNCIQSVLSQRVELSPQFKENYESWLEMEVFSNQIDWDQIMRH